MKPVLVVDFVLLGMGWCPGSFQIPAMRTGLQVVESPFVAGAAEVAEVQRLGLTGERVAVCSKRGYHNSVGEMVLAAMVVWLKQPRDWSVGWLQD